MEAKLRAKCKGGAIRIQTRQRGIAVRREAARQRAERERAAIRMQTMRRSHTARLEVTAMAQERARRQGAVSYTHLTLPTILLV